MSATNIRAEAVPLLVCVTLGVALATLPHWWTGQWDWIADYDELAFYLPAGAQAYREHPWRLADPVTAGPTYYQPLSVVPGIMLAKVLGLGPWLIGLCWRVWGGALVAAGWYGVCRLQLSPKAAAVATCALLADPGVMNGQLGYALAKTVVRHWQDKVDAPTPTSASLPQWRIWNPVLSWPWWFAFLGLTARAVCQPTLVRRVAAGISCGLLFHVYFYLWTTAVAGLVLASLLDRRRLDTYLTILGIGVAVGLPALLAAMHFRLTFGSDWLLRTDKFVPLSNRWKELLIPRVSLLLLIVSWIWVWRYRMEYRWLACLATAALLLLNHTLVTGLQIENFHWNYALGPSLSLLVVFMIAHVIQWGPAWLQRNGSGLAIAWAGAVLLVGSALWARAAGGLPENRHIYQVVRAYRSLSGVWPVEQGAAVAGDADFQYMAAVAAGLRPLAGYSALLSPISDAEFDERLALNAYLLGQNREEFETHQRAWLKEYKWGLEARSLVTRERRVLDRLAAWDRVTADVKRFLDRFDVRLLARPTDISREPPPTYWKLLEASPHWTIWIRTD